MLAQLGKSSKTGLPYTSWVSGALAVVVWHSLKMEKSFMCRGIWITNHFSEMQTYFFQIKNHFKLCQWLRLHIVLLYSNHVCSWKTRTFTVSDPKHLNCRGKKKKKLILEPVYSFFSRVVWKSLHGCFLFIHTLNLIIGRALLNSC